MPKITDRFRCVGMMFNERTNIDDLENALDFKNRHFFGEDLERELEMGILPNGMLLQAIGSTTLGKVVTVGTEQEVRVI
jgi:hypothetical protein